MNIEIIRLKEMKELIEKGAVIQFMLLEINENGKMIEEKYPIIGTPIEVNEKTQCVKFKEDMDLYINQIGKYYILQENYKPIII